MVFGSYKFNVRLCGKVCHYQLYVYNRFINKIIILKNLPKNTAMQKNVTHYCLHREIGLHYYFNLKNLKYFCGKKDSSLGLSIAGRLL